MSAGSRGTKALAIGFLIGGLALGTGSLFFALASVILEYPTRKSLVVATVGIAFVMIVALPAVLVGMRTAPEMLSRGPLFLLLNDFIRLTIGFSVAALLAVLGFGLLSGGSLVAGGLVSLLALVAAYAALRRLRAAVGRLRQRGVRPPRERAEP